jgi:hypothetical protein
MQLAMTVGSIVIGGLIVVGIIGFLFEKYANTLEDADTGSKKQDPAYERR